jgi:hypothetical protein
VSLYLSLDIPTYQYVRLRHSKKSAMAEHRFSYDYHIQFHNTKMLASKLGYMNKLIENVTEMEPHSDSTNRDNGLILN